MLRMRRQTSNFVKEDDTEVRRMKKKKKPSGNLKKNSLKRKYYLRFS